MDENQKPDFVSPPQELKPPTNLNHRHEWRLGRFLVSESTFKLFSKQLDLPSEPPTAKDWNQVQRALEEGAKTGNAQAKLAAEIAATADTPEQFLASALDNLSGVLKRAGWRIPKPSVNEDTPPLSPSLQDSSK